MPKLYIVAPENPAPSMATQAARLAVEFADQCGLRPLPYMAEEMARYLMDGFAPEMISEAIARTARAPRPSFAYLAAIMRNAKDAGQFDYQSFTAPRSTRRTAAYYSGQRQYTEEELQSFSVDLIEEARKLYAK